LVIGWSMGAGQAFQWATSFPDMVERILPLCGSARTSPHNVVSCNNTVCGLFLSVALALDYKEIKITQYSDEGSRSSLF
jgi:pimeloyl-ACP methyl ester carboxylesterase